MMARPLILLALTVVVLVRCSSAFQCSGNSLTAGFASCADLQSSALAWTYAPANNTASIAYMDTALSTSGWVGWGVNFNGSSMVNSDALVAFKQPNGTASILRYKLTSAVYNDISLPLTPVGAFDILQVLNMSTLISGTSFTILATLRLPPGFTSINTVYNRGPSVTNNVPAPHNSGQRNGMKTIDLTTGSVFSSQAPHHKLKNIHGALAVASWGVLIILGAMTARYIKQLPFADPGWFYMHVTLQTVAYLLGVIAWAIGLRLGVLSPGVEYHSHRSIGISIFTLASVQMLSLFARPHKQHKLRMYWNIYHHSFGYSVIILGVINVFKGFNILAPPVKYKGMYIAFIVIAACASVALEAGIWCHFFRERKEHHKQHAAMTTTSRPVAAGAVAHDTTTPSPKWAHV